MKAISDIVCTSGNAVKIAQAAPKDRDFPFIPDEHLGAWVIQQPLWRGNCYAHVEFRRDSLLRLKTSCPEAKIVVHVESLREVRDLADGGRRRDVGR